MENINYPPWVNDVIVVTWLGSEVSKRQHKSLVGYLCRQGPVGGGGVERKRRKGEKREREEKMKYTCKGGGKRKEGGGIGRGKGRIGGQKEGGREVTNYMLY